MPISHAPRPHFLIATDLAPAFRPHVEHAARLADRLDAHVTLFHAVLPATPDLHGAPLLPTMPSTEPSATSRRDLHELAEAVRGHRPVHMALVTATDPARAVLAAAAAAHADVVVLPTRARTGLRRLAFGSVAETVLHQARLPVVLLTDAMVAPRSPHTASGPRPIVLATDLSEAAAKAFPIASELARRLALPIVLVSVVPRTQGARLDAGLPVAPPVIDPQIVQAERLAALQPLAASLAAPSVDIQVVIDDDAAAAIATMASSRDAEFVVMATHGRSGLMRALLGSVTEAVVHRSHVPVFCVPARA